VEVFLGDSEAESQSSLPKRRRTHRERSKLEDIRALDEIDREFEWKF
jgi:hypothetical protein